MLDLVIKVRF